MSSTEDGKNGPSEDDIAQMFIERGKQAVEALKDSGVEYSIDTDGVYLPIGAPRELIDQLQKLGYTVIRLSFGPAIA